MSQKIAYVIRIGGRSRIFKPHQRSKNVVDSKEYFYMKQENINFAIQRN